MTGKRKILRNAIKMVTRNLLYNPLFQEVAQSPEEPRLLLELKVLRTLLTFSQIPNADLEEIPKSWTQTTSDAPRDQLLSTNLRKLRSKITLVFYAKILNQMPDTRLLP